MKITAAMLAASAGFELPLKNELVLLQSIRFNALSQAKS
jgi:hypothetical protein